MTMPEMTESVYLGWLASAKLPADCLRQMLQQLGSASDIYRMAVRDGQTLNGILPETYYGRLVRTSGKENLLEISRSLSERRISVMSLRDPGFPEILEKITDPVSILFYQGDPSCLSARTISMVGSRQASYAGLKAARQIARDLSRAGVSVVSGFAYGIDAMSHTGCLEGESPTVAVMGCGLDQNYPSDHAQLRKKIIESGGLLLSEYAPGEKPLAANFPYRNRIISALGEALILVEAKIRSGSLRTVDHALRQGRDVFVYPGDPASPHFEGNHQLLREGARYFTTAQDILEDMNWLDKEPPDVQNSGCIGSSADASSPEEKIRRMLIPGELSFDQIAAGTAIPPAELLSVLTIMHVHGKIEMLPGKKYQLKH